MDDLPDDLKELLGSPETPAVDPLALSPADRTKIAAWLQSKSRNGHCPVCNTTSWTVGGHLLHGLVSSPDGGLTIGGSAYPMAMVVCDNCFYFRTFMALPMGLDFVKKDGGDV